MLYTVFIDLNNGSVARATIEPNKAEYPPNTLKNGFLIQEFETEIPLEQLHERIHWNGSALVENSPKPTTFHTWNFLNGWVVEESMLAVCLQHRLFTVNILREEKDLENLLYDEKILQVRTQDRDNITGKIQDIKIKQELSLPIVETDLIWKDYNNVIHSWETAADFLNWLQLLVVSIASRRTHLYIVSWNHKENLENLSADAEQTLTQKLQNILNYDITTGW